MKNSGQPTYYLTGRTGKKFTEITNWDIYLYTFDSPIAVSSTTTSSLLADANKTPYLYPPCTAGPRRRQPRGCPSWQMKRLQVTISKSKDTIPVLITQTWPPASDSFFPLLLFEIERSFQGPYPKFQCVWFLNFCNGQVSSSSFSHKVQVLKVQVLNYKSIKADQINTFTLKRLT